MHLYRSIQQQKLAYAGHILRGSSGQDTLQILEGKFDTKTAQRRPRRTWLDDIIHWTKLNNSIPLSFRFNGHFPGEPGLAGVY